MLPSQRLFLGALQGVSELFPVSSLAQTILLPALLGWDLGDSKDADFLAFVVALHLGTAVALVIYFWKDWKLVIAAYLGSIRRRKLVYDEYSKLAWLLVAGSIVVGLLGLLFERRLRELFDNRDYAWIVAAILIFNGLLMLFADVVKRRVSQPKGSEQREIPPTSDPAADLPDQRKAAHELTFIEGASVGATQAFALLPGISRSGVTIVAGLLAGLSYEEAGRFSFMLGTVAIGMAGALKVPKLLTHAARPELAINFASAVLAGLTAYFSTMFLMKYFRHHRLGPFGWYCIFFGIFALVKLHH